MRSFDALAVLFERLRHSPAWKRQTREERAPLYYAWMAAAMRGRPAKTPATPADNPPAAPPPAPSAAKLDAPLTQRSLFPLEA